MTCHDTPAPHRGSSSRPLIFFVHVPKTAGTTVNAYLQDHLPLGSDHCEAFWTHDALLKHWLNEADWLSGHIPFDEALRRIPKLTDRPVRYFTCLRTPMKHLRSTYNWLFELYDRGNDFYSLIHPDFQRLSEIVRSNENTASAIADVMTTNAQIFSNIQTTTVLGADIKYNPLGIISRIRKYEMIGNDHNLINFIQKMIEKDVYDDKYLNIANYHFDQYAFYSPEIKAFMRKYNRRDELFYKFATSKWLDAVMR